MSKVIHNRSSTSHCCCSIIISNWNEPRKIESNEIKKQSILIWPGKLTCHVHSFFVEKKIWKIGRGLMMSCDKQMKMIHEYYMNARTEDRLRQAIVWIWWFFQSVVSPKHATREVYVCSRFAKRLKMRTGGVSDRAANSIILLLTEWMDWGNVKQITCTYFNECMTMTMYYYYYDAL